MGAHWTKGKELLKFLALLLTINAYAKGPTLKQLGHPQRQRSYFTKMQAKVEVKHKHLYCLPFKAGEAFRLANGYGQTSHQGMGKFGLDFAMPVGSAVASARAGTVVQVVNTLKGSSTRKSEFVQGNKIFIQHTDGSMARYGHLKTYGALVKLGDQVKTGQIIGYSGNTGRSSGPHLHFDVVQKVGNEWRTIPVEFRLSHGAAPLVVGSKYRASDNCQ